MSSKLRTKIATAVIGATTIISLSIPSAFGQTALDLQAQINALLQQISLLQAQLAAGGATTGAAPCTPPTSNLTLGSSGAGVQCLQKLLNFLGFTVSATGAGSPGNESTYFGARTRAAVSAAQAAWGVSPTAGYYGPLTRAALNSALATQPPPPPPPTGTPTPTGTPPPPGVGTGLTVSLASDQPTAGLFGESFANRPFTKLVLTASADGAATVTGLRVERTGQSNDAVFNGVIGLDDEGFRMGDAKTFGSDHRLTLTDTFTVAAGASRTITIAGDSDSDQDAYAGQIACLSLIGVNVSGGTTVNATYPLTGTCHTVNATLAIGTITAERGPRDPGTNITKEIGTTGYTFSSLKLTAGSNEDVSLKSVRFNQSSSAASSDLANIKVYVADTAYTTTVSSDGKFFNASFGNGITILKGESTEVYVKGDIVGGSNRGIDMDLYRGADIKAEGIIYGYGILPAGFTGSHTATDDDGSLGSSNPNYDAFEVTIGAGSITVERATSVGAQNIAENLSDQALGGFVADVKGEPVSVAAMNFDVSTIEAAGTGGSLDSNDITNIKLIKDDGTVVAGPVDGVAAGNNAIRFTDTVTFPVGRSTYTLKGKIGTDFSQNDQTAASTTPSSDWTTVRGVSSTQTITPSGGTVTMSTMTIKVGSLTFALSTDTASSSPDLNVVAGSNAVTFAKYVLDATESGEDLRATSVQLDLITSQPGNASDDLTNCSLWDGNTSLNTGTNVVNPTNSQAAGQDYTFTFDTGLIIPKGTVKTLALKCNLIAGGTITRAGWGSAGLSTAANQIVVTGVTSGTAVAETTTTNSGRTIVVQSAGTLSIALDSASPSLKLVQAATTDQTLSVIRLNSLYEDIRVDLLGLQIATSTASNEQANASNSPADLTKVTLWDGTTKVGEVVFTSDYATATLSNFVIPADGQKLLTIKADISSVNVSLSQAIPGHLINVDWDGAWGDLPDDDTREGAQGAKAVGLSSGQTIYPGTAATVNTDTASNGARIVRAIPTLTKLSTSGKFTNTSDQVLFRFKVEAPAGTNGVSLYKFHFTLATTTTAVTDYGGSGEVDEMSFRVTNIRTFCYSDASFSLGSCGSSTGQLNQFGLLVADGAAANVDFSDPADTTDADADFDVFFNPTATSGATPEAIRVSAGDTRYFELKANVVGASSTPNIATRLHGDAAWIGVTSNADNAKLTVSNTDYSVVGAVDSGPSYFTAVASMVSASVGTTTNLNYEGDFVWSDNATNSTQSIDSYSWVNGFLLPGLPTSFTSSEVLSL